MNEMKLLSLIVPAYNEEDNLHALQKRLNPVFDTLKSKNVDVEVILLDNCSKDRTPEIGKQICRDDRRWKYVRYSKNFGYHGSLAGGFDMAKGDALIVLASDLQEPPEMIPQMVDLWLQGYDIAYGVLKARNDQNLIKTLGAKIFYRLYPLVSDSYVTPFATDFRIISRRVVDSVKEMREVDRYLRGLIHWVGFKQIAFEYDRDKRTHGKSTAGVWVSWQWGLNAIFCFSNKPLRAVTAFGFFATVISVLLTLYFLTIYFFPPSFMPVPPTGTTALAVLILFGIGVNALSLGIIGEYVGRIYNQIKLRPLYIVDESLNIVPPHSGNPLPIAREEKRDH